MLSPLPFSASSCMGLNLLTAAISNDEHLDCCSSHWCSLGTQGRSASELNEDQGAGLAFFDTGLVFSQNKLRKLQAPTPETPQCRGETTCSALGKCCELSKLFSGGIGPIGTNPFVVSIEHIEY